MRALSVLLLLVAMSLAACGTDDPAADAPRPSGEPSTQTTRGPDGAGDVFSGVALAGADRFEAVIADIAALTPAPGAETVHAAVQALADEAGASVDLCVGVFAEPR